VLAIDDPTSEDESDFFIILDYIFLALYTLEMVLKIFGMGFVLAKGTYLRDAWNVLDFVIVTTGYISFFGDGSLNLNVLRSFRVLRPLRTISNVEGLKMLMSALFGSLPLLGNTLIILLFFFLIFAIGGLQLWMGILWYRCVRIQDGYVELDKSGEEELCGSRQCPEGFNCVLYINNPNYGVTNFDDILSSLLVIFQCVTLEGWSNVMIMVQKAFNQLSFLFFVPLVFIGAFFLLNLTLAVIKSKVGSSLEQSSM
jgi:hypothetical protein